jgi:alpha-mannosidase
MRVTEEGPLRASVAFTYQLSESSSLRQVVSLTAVSPRLDFATEVEWHESQRFLKVEFPWDLRSMEATYEVQFGYLRRPTHFNTSWDMARFEVCGHRWADLAEPDYGVALLNDCKYGYGTEGNVMRLSLLRSPGAPDPHADRGPHRFTYAVLPHLGSFQEAGVIDEAQRLNVPLHLRRTYQDPRQVTWFHVDREAIVIDTVKKAEDSEAIIVRLYESHGTRGHVRLTSTLPVTAAGRCNLLERADTPLDWSDGGCTLPFRPFEILTLKLQTG